MDTNGTVLIRDLSNSQNVTITYNISKGNACETGYLLYNTQVLNELFIFFNNEMEVYDGQG